MRRSGGKIQKQTSALSPTGAVISPNDAASPASAAAASVSPSGRFLLRATGLSPRKRTQKLPRAPNSPPAFLSPSSPVQSPLNAALESSFLTSDELDHAASEWIQSAGAVSPPPIQLSSPVPYSANQHVSPLAKQAAVASALSESQHKLSVLTELHSQQSEQVTKLEQQRSQLEQRCKQLEVELKLTGQEKTMLLGTANRHAQQLATAHAELDAATARERALEEVNERDTQALQQLQTKLNDVNIQYLQQRTESERLAASYVSSMRQLELSHQNDLRVAKNEGKEAARKEFEKLMLEREQAWEIKEKEKDHQRELERQQELELRQSEVFEKPSHTPRHPSVSSNESARPESALMEPAIAAHDAEVAQAQLQAILDEQAKTAEAHAMAAEMQATHEAEMAETTANHAALQKLYDDLQASHSSLESTVRALHVEKEELEASLELHNETAKVMEEEHNSMTKQLQESQRRLTQLETDEAALRLSLESETRSSAESQAKSVQLERENKQMEQSLRKVVADSEQQRDAERAVTVEWNRQKADLTKELAQAQIKITKLQQKLTTANQGVAANASGMEKHTKQLQELQQLHDSTDAAYQAAKVKLAKSAAREQKLQEERVELLKKLDSHARDRKALEGQVTTANQSLAAATKATESKTESLKNVKEQLKQESESTQAKLKVATEMTIAADAKARAAQSLLEKKEVEIIALQDRVAKLEVVVAEAEAAKLAKKTAPESAAETAIEDEKKLADDSKSPDSSISPSKTSPSPTRTELDVIRDEHAELSAQHQQLQEEFDTVQQEVASLLTQRDELQSANTDLLAQLNAQQASIDDARQTTIHAVQHMQLRNGEIDALSAEHRREIESMNLSHQVIINQLQHQLITSHQKALRAEMNFTPMTQRSSSHLPVGDPLSPIPMFRDEDLLSPAKSTDTSVRSASCEHSCPVHASRSDRYELLSMLESQSLTMEQLLNEKQQILQANSGDATTIVAQLQQQSAQQQQKLHDLERELQQAQTLLAASTAAAASSPANASAAASQELAALQKRNEELEASLEQLTRRLNATETQSDSLAQESLRQINELEEELKRTKEAAHINQEAEREQITAAEAGSRAAELASTLEAASRRSNTELVALQELHAQELTKWRLNMSKLEQDHQRLKLSSDQLTHRNSELESENKERMLHVCQLTTSLDQLNHTVASLKSGTVLVDNDAKISDLTIQNAQQKEQIAQLTVRIQQQQQSMPVRLQQLEQTVLELQGTVAESEKLLDAAQRQQQSDALAAAASATRLSTVEGELSRSEQSLAAAIDARLFAEQRLSQLELQLKLQSDRFEVEKKQWDTTKAMVESEIVLEHINPDGNGNVDSPASPQHQQAIAMLEATIQQSGAAYQVAQANHMRQQEVHEKQLKELQSHHREQLDRIEQQHLLVRHQFETEIDSLRRQIREKQLSVDQQLFTQQQQHGDELNALVEKHTQAMHELEDQSNQLLHELSNKESDLNATRSDLTSERLARTALQASSAASTHLHSELSNASSAAVEQHMKEREMLMELIKVQEQVIEESKDEHETTRNGTHTAPLSSAIVPLLAQLQSKADLSRDLQHQLFLATSNVERLELYASGLEQQIRGTSQVASTAFNESFTSRSSTPAAASTMSSNSLNITKLASPAPMPIATPSNAAFTPVLPVSLTSVLADSSINPTASVESVSRPTYLSSMLQALHEEQRATDTAPIPKAV